MPIYVMGMHFCAHFYNKLFLRHVDLEKCKCLSLVNFPFNFSCPKFGII